MGERYPVVHQQEVHEATVRAAGLTGIWGAAGPVSPPPVLTTREVARMLKISESAVRRLNLPAVEVARGKWRYVTEQVLATLKARAA